MLTQQLTLRDIVLLEDITMYDVSLSYRLDCTMISLFEIVCTYTHQYLSWRQFTLSVVTSSFLLHLNFRENVPQSREMYRDTFHSRDLL